MPHHPTDQSSHPFMKSPDSQLAVQFDNVTKAFATTLAVRGLSFPVRKGCIFGLLGPNGAGKTTTIRLLTGILHATGGSVSVLGGNAPPQVRSRIGYLPEEKGLYKRMRVRDYLVFAARLKELAKSEAQTRADALLERFAFEEWRSERCDRLSKGMGQKVQIMATLIHEPDLVVLDEPFSGLDPVNVELVRVMMREIRDGNRTVVFSTHVMEQAELLCEDLVLINKGKTVLAGNLSEILAGYGNSVRIHYQGNGAALRDLDEVLSVSDTGQTAELRMPQDADTQALLAKLIQRVEVRKFDLTHLSLHEVFLREVNATPPTESGESDDA